MKFVSQSSYGEDEGIVPPRGPTVDELKVWIEQIRGERRALKSVVAWLLNRPQQDVTLDDAKELAAGAIEVAAAKTLQARADKPLTSADHGLNYVKRAAINYLRTQLDRVDRGGAAGRLLGEMADLTLLSVPDKHGGPLYEAAHRDLLNRIRPVLLAAINGLSPEDREFLASRCEQGQTFRELGELHGTTVNAAANRWYCIRRELRRDATLRRLWDELSSLEMQPGSQRDPSNT